MEEFTQAVNCGLCSVIYTKHLKNNYEISCITKNLVNFES